MEKSLRKNKKRRIASITCNILGTVILVGIIVLLLPVTLPRLFGGDAFHVISGSMEPAIPVDSVVFVQATSVADIKEGDVIAFYSEESIVTHRVVKNQVVEGKIITKGDANAKEDMNPVGYEYVIGKVWFHMPYLGAILNILTSRVGKIYMLFLTITAILCYILAAELGR